MHRTRDRTTMGLTSTLSPNDEKYRNFRFFFFETDKPYNNEHYQRLVKLYARNQLDVLVHQTGGGGLHWLSPTLITKDLWKELMDQVKDINTKCPMICLRTRPNKYVEESDVWYKSTAGYSGETAEFFNIEELCFLLNKWFGSHFQSRGLKGLLRFVKYPLPREITKFAVPTERHRLDRIGAV